MMKPIQEWLVIMLALTNAVQSGFDCLENVDMQCGFKVGGIFKYSKPIPFEACRTYCQNRTFCGAFRWRSQHQGNCDLYKNKCTIKRVGNGFFHKYCLRTPYDDPEETTMIPTTLPSVPPESTQSPDQTSTSTTLFTILSTTVDPSSTRLPTSSADIDSTLVPAVSPTSVPPSTELLRTTMPEETPSFTSSQVQTLDHGASSTQSVSETMSLPVSPTTIRSTASSDDMLEGSGDENWRTLYSDITPTRTIEMSPETPSFTTASSLDTEVPSISTSDTLMTTEFPLETSLVDYSTPATILKSSTFQSTPALPGTTTIDSSVTSVVPSDGFASTAAPTVDPDMQLRTSHSDIQPTTTSSDWLMTTILPWQPSNGTANQTIPVTEQIKPEMDYWWWILLLITNAIGLIFLIVLLIMCFYYRCRSVSYEVARREGKLPLNGLMDAQVLSPYQKPDDKNPILSPDEMDAFSEAPSDIVTTDYDENASFVNIYATSKV